MRHEACQRERRGSLGQSSLLGGDSVVQRSSNTVARLCPNPSQNVDGKGAIETKTQSNRGEGVVGMEDSLVEG